MNVDSVSILAKYPTVNDVDANGSRLGVSGGAGVVSGVCSRCTRHHQLRSAGVFVCNHANTAAGAVVDELGTLIPVDILGRLRTASHRARQVDVAAGHHV